MLATAFGIQNILCAHRFIRHILYKQTAIGARMLPKNSADEQLYRDIEEVSTSIEALCELLAAAQHVQVNAASIHTLLRPISRRLDVMAGTLSDGTAMPQ